MTMKKILLNLKSFAIKQKDLGSNIVGDKTYGTTLRTPGSRQELPKPLTTILQNGPRPISKE